MPLCERHRPRLCLWLDRGWCERLDPFTDCLDAGSVGPRGVSSRRGLDELIVHPGPFFDRKVPSGLEAVDSTLDSSYERRTGDCHPLVGLEREGGQGGVARSDPNEVLRALHSPFESAGVGVDRRAVAEGIDEFEESCPSTHPIVDGDAFDLARELIASSGHTDRYRVIEFIDLVVELTNPSCAGANAAGNVAAFLAPAGFESFEACEL